MTTPPSTFGRDLLAHARANGVTSSEVAALLALPVAAVAALTGPDDLDHHSAATLRVFAGRLGLPWPEWLTTGPGSSRPVPDHHRDPARVHAVLAYAFGHGLQPSEIAHILQWTIDRVQAALLALASRVRPGGGTRVHFDGTTAVLELAPGALDDTIRHRLRQVLQVYGLEPDPKVLHLLYTVIGMHGDGPSWLYDNQGLLDEAIDHRLLVQDTQPADGTRTNLRLHPDVQYGLAITQYRYPPEPPADAEPHDG
ncbi:hypothetical protein [Actinoplanes sp. NPDC051851]|uniref:hypothetical protein n=1 Tax=Actinoplanes sp. NPDC051851 TaxID=3154753 RepID=UPI00341D6B0E